MNQKFFISGAIVVAGLVIAWAVVAGPGEGTQPTGHSNGGSAQVGVSPINDDDHILGDRNARVSVVEFSDFECPFCSRLHPTLERVVEDFDGEVNWVYRHFPLSTIHSRAVSAAVASECVADLAGNDAFWTFASRVFGGGTSALGDTLYNQIASDVGIDLDEFASCRELKEVEDRVAADFNDARRSGGSGTPYVVVINENGDTFPFSGALPYENIVTIINQALGS